MLGFQLSYKKGLPHSKRSGKLYVVILKNYETFSSLVVNVMVEVQVV